MTNHEHPKPVVLTIAGFDPSGRSGIIADVRTIESFACTAVASVTSVTFQTDGQFFGALHQPAESVRAQVEAILDATSIAAVKIGMLPTAEIVRDVARLIRESNLPAPVIDPVMQSTSGGKLMSDEAFEAFVTELLPLARVLTPNIPEAERLSGMSIQTEEDMRPAAARIRELGVRAVLVKGGHMYRTASGSERVKATTYASGAEAVDILDDNNEVTVFRGEWIPGAAAVRGTGCMLSSAIAACLAQRINLGESVAAAKQLVTYRIRSQNRQLTTDD